MAGRTATGETTIFSKAGGSLHPVEVSPFVDEAALQLLVAENPDLIAAAIEREPGSVALVKREAGIPVQEGGADHFATDHLFVTDDGVPIIVEVKRASNTEVRRRIVGQMLDYAANATRYWSADRLREWCDQLDGEGPGWLADAVEPDDEGTPLWQEMYTNLAAGRFHLLFVADGIPAELRSIIDFLGRHLNTVAVAGAEIRQFGSAGAEVVNVERVATQAPALATTKAASLDELTAGASADFLRLLELVEAWVTAPRKLIPRSRSYRIELPHLGSVMYLYSTYDNLEFRLGRIRRTIGPTMSEKIADRITALPGGTHSPDFCSIPAPDAVANWDSGVRPTLDAIMNDLLQARAAD